MRKLLYFLGGVLAILLVAVAMSAPAHAGEASVSWKNATTDTTGAPLPATGPDALKETRVAIGTCSSPGVFGTQIGTFSTVPATVLSVLFPNLADGVYCFRAHHATNAGVVSNWSATVSKTIATAPLPKKPRPPTDPQAS